MQAYSRLKRLAVLAARDTGKPTSEVAKKFGVSPSWVRRVVQERRELGKLVPYQLRKRDRHSAPVSTRVIDMVLEDPRITVREIERVLGRRLDIVLLEITKSILEVRYKIIWYGGRATQLVRSPTGNVTFESYHDSPIWDL